MNPEQAPSIEHESMAHVVVGLLQPEVEDIEEGTETVPEKGLWLNAHSCELVKPDCSMRTRNSAYLKQRAFALLESHEKDHIQKNKVSE